MILDAFLNFDNNVSVAIAAGTQASTNVLDFGGPAIPALANLVGARDMGVGNPLQLLIQVSTAFASAASAGTLKIGLQGATDNGSGVPAAYSTWWETPIYTTAQLVAGARLWDADFPRPPQGIAMPRFVRLLYTVASATMTAGNIFAAIVLTRDDQPYQSTNNAVQGGYPAGITINN